MRTLMTVSLMAATMLSACASTPHIRTAADPGPGYTRDYMVDIYTGYDASGNIRTTRPLTATEAHMLAATDQHCIEKTHEVDAIWQGYIKDGVKGGFLIGLGTAVGAVLGSFTSGGMSFLNYLKYGAGSGLGSGVFTAEQKREQALKIVHSYCMLQWVQKNSNDYADRRLKDIIIIPMMVGRAKLPGVDPHARTPTHEEEFSNDDRGSEPQDAASIPAPQVAPPPQ